jgi:(p)ppGpp synthase/HD superfamily hydrolase
MTMSETMGPQEHLAREIAIKAHGSTINAKTGEVYISHPEHVASQVTGDEAKAVGWLHDVVEDTSYTLDDLRAAGLSDEVVEAVEAMTHRPGETYFDYVRRAAANPLARQVKEADLRHNLNLGRIPMPTERDLERIRTRYLPALRIVLGK